VQSYKGQMIDFKNVKVKPETHKRFMIHVSRLSLKNAEKGLEQATQDTTLNYLLDEYDRTHIAESIRHSKLKRK